MGGFQSFAAVVSLPSEKDGSGHSERVKIEDFSAVPHGGSEPILLKNSRFPELIFAE